MDCRIGLQVGQWARNLQEKLSTIDLTLVAIFKEAWLPQIESPVAANLFTILLEV